MRILFLLLAFGTFGFGAEGDACRCCRGNGVYAPWVKGLGVPEKRADVGSSDLVISTESVEAKVWFSQGVALLHCFWEFEAYRCFLEVVKADPECAMGYWGVAMSLPSSQVDSVEERDSALELAKKHVVKGSAQERLYVEMLDKLLNEGSEEAGLVFERVIKAFPDDVDARCFLAYWIRDGYDLRGKANIGTVKGIALLEEGMRRKPWHVGAGHYLVHLKEAGPDYGEVLGTAEKLLDVGKGSSHLVHMPGHVYYLMGEYGKACEVFKLCHEMELAYFAREKVAAVNLPNFLHNLHFWVVAEAERGDLDEAIRICGLLGDEKEFLGREGAAASQQFRYLKRTLAAEVNLRFREYGKAVEAIDLEGLDEGGALYWYAKFLKVYGEWMGMRGGEELDLMEKAAEVREAFDRFETTVGEIDGGSEYREAVRALMVANSLRDKWLIWKGNLGGGLNERGLDLARDYELKLPYAEPPFVLVSVDESLGWLALEKGMKREAKAFFERALKRRPKSWHVLEGLKGCE